MLQACSGRSGYWLYQPRQGRYCPFIQLSAFAGSGIRTPYTWQNEEPRPFPATIKVTAKNEKGMLAAIATEIANFDVNIQGLILTTTIDAKAEVDFTVEVTDAVHLYQLMDKIRKLPNIYEVVRGMGDYA